MPTFAIVACVVLTALFLLVYGVSREPRHWRRLYQHKFCKGQEVSVNKNKAMDEVLARNSKNIAMVIFVLDMLILIWGVTVFAINQQPTHSAEDRARLKDMKRVQQGSGIQQ